jgi:cytochrome c553
MKSLITLVLLTLASTGVSAADIKAGKAKAAVCAGCHGPEGISFIPSYPNLKGQKSAYIIKQMNDFKKGLRKDPVMTAQAKMLSDEDIVNIAAFYQSLGNK